MILQKLINESNGMVLSESVEPTNLGLTLENGDAEATVRELTESVNMIDIMFRGAELQLSEGVLSESCGMDDVLALQENAFENAKNGLIEGFKKAWRKFLEILNALKLQILAVVSDKAFIKEANDKIKNAKFEEGYVKNGFVFTLDAIDPTEAFLKMKATIDKKYQNAYSASSAEDVSNAVGSGKRKDVKSELIEVAGFKADEKLAKQLFVALRNGEEKGKELTIGKAEAMKALNGFIKAKDDIKSLEKDINTMFKSAIAAVKEFKGELKTEAKGADADGKALSSAKISGAGKHSAALSAAVSISSQMINAKMSALKACNNQQKLAVRGMIYGKAVTVTTSNE